MDNQLPSLITGGYIVYGDITQQSYMGTINFGWGDKSSR